MIRLAVPGASEKNFQLEAVSAATPRVRFSGNGDAEAIAPLNRFLKSLHDELITQKATCVAVDLGDLYFMNSSCLKAFVGWIHEVDTSGRPYAIELLTNPRLAWQARSLATLQRLAPEVVGVRESDA